MNLSNTWLKVKIFFIRNFYIVGLVWWKHWSRFHRKYVEDDYDFVTLPDGWDPETAGLVLTLLRWQPDGGKELWDVCRSAEWVEYCIKNVEEGFDQPSGALDCDEFANWAVNVLDHKYLPCMLTVAWVSSTKEILGHVLCIGRHNDGRLFHLGNWGHHGGFISLRSLCKDIMDKTSSNEFVAWGLLDAELKL